ncbi:hypothetical protein TNCV_3941841 [Trichonephila clavipes]|uniref:Uncharacterized protein n=1 Tax=Trichonephila clavipes TaxID=2585209 RepID=A0A8X7BA91_TRICX|nr:hypothetical protein TNCV_3941841 [Trichonephila clavipes]
MFPEYKEHEMNIPENELVYIDSVNENETSKCAMKNSTDSNFKNVEMIASMLRICLVKGSPERINRFHIEVYGDRRANIVLDRIVNRSPNFSPVPKSSSSLSLHLLSSPTATAGSDVVQSGRPLFDDFFQHLWPYIGNNTANVVFQMVKRLWLIRIDQ